MLRFLKTAITNDDKGATAIEYALIAVGIAVAIFTSIFLLGDTVLHSYFGRIADIFTL